MNTLPAGYHIAAMTYKEAEQLMDWAVSEGWNPGYADLEVAWGYDPTAFIALRFHAEGRVEASELVGGGVILSYGGRAGFMGLFIMRPDYRGRGLGRVLWYERLHRLRSRLQPTAWIGMDGVFAMAPFYAAGGFHYLYRDLRYQGLAPAEAVKAQPPPGVSLISLRDLPFDQLQRYDLGVFGVPRGDFLRRWVAASGVMGYAAIRSSTQSEGVLVGYGVLRPCRVGYKLGPVFADDADTARTVVYALMSGCPGAQVQIDVPEPNTMAVELATVLGWTESFGCARMVHGEAPPDTYAKVFGVTSFEFG